MFKDNKLIVSDDESGDSDGDGDGDGPCKVQTQVYEDDEDQIGRTYPSSPHRIHCSQNNSFISEMQSQLWFWTPILIMVCSTFTPIMPM